MTGTTTASGDTPSSASNPNSRSGVRSAATPGEKNLTGGGVVESVKRTAAVGFEAAGGVVPCAFLLRLLVWVAAAGAAEVGD
jgi:hypothetical protein